MGENWKTAYILLQEQTICSDSEAKGELKKIKSIDKIENNSNNSNNNNNNNNNNCGEDAKAGEKSPSSTKLGARSNSRGLGVDLESDDTSGLDSKELFGDLIAQKKKDSKDKKNKKKNKKPEEVAPLLPHNTPKKKE